jgi:hypothetical protein
MTFNSTSENGPPVPVNPILFAGTCSEYSKKAIPQLKIITDKRLKFSKRLIVFSFRCPYQAKVIKALDITRRNTVLKPFINKYS